jgi:hypothetical protein
MPSLYDLAARLQDFAGGGLSREDLERWFTPILGADSLDIMESDGAEWEHAPHEAQLFWRLIYEFESSDVPDDALRALAERTVRSLASTASAADTLELLPMLVDQHRFCAIVDRYADGIISRTGFLSVIANSGYPPHAKLWLEHAGLPAVRGLCAAMSEGRYAAVARAMEQAPG